ncbi:site-specific tyrosine recombinase XerD [Streptococcus didelphis]
MINDLVEAFLKQKKLSQNTQKSYRYDLLQFISLIEGHLSQARLAIYKQHINGLSLAAKKRKYSTINQFLLYLYQVNYSQAYYQLGDKIRLPQSQLQKDLELLDKDLFYKESQYKEGQLIALLIFELGLRPNELAAIRLVDLDLSFRILQVNDGHKIRILKLPKRLLPFIEARMQAGTYLFDNKGKPLSRQWFFNHLKTYLNSLGLEKMTAQKLREQYILSQKAEGKTIMELSQQLGLNSPITLEKYFKA